jgi:hypothetical protein
VFAFRAGIHPAENSLAELVSLDLNLIGIAFRCIESLLPLSDISHPMRIFLHLFEVLDSVTFLNLRLVCAFQPFIILAALELLFCFT